MSATVVPTTITVSGYAPIAAFRCTEGMRSVGSAVHSAVLLGLLAREQLVFTSVRGAMSDRARCESCLRWLLRDELDGAYLGLTRYCPECVRLVESRCRERHGRLPFVEALEEFVCPSCVRIADQHDRAPKDADGRTRNVCRWCRASQVAAAGKRRECREP